MDTNTNERQNNCQQQAPEEQYSDEQCDNELGTCCNHEGDEPCCDDKTPCCENVENCDDNESKKFSSPEAGMERLAKIPQNVYKALCLLPIDASFKECVMCIRERCENCRSTMELHCHERMWTHMVFSMCMNFNRDQFGTRSSNNNSIVPQELMDYMRCTPILDMLQLFIDISQQNGFQAQKSLEMMNQENQSKRFTSREYDDAQALCRALKQLYHNFVDLYRHCTGTWKPRRMVNRGPGSRPPMQYQPRQQQMTGQRGSYVQNDNMQGSMQGNQGNRMQNRPPRSNNGYNNNSGNYNQDRMANQSGEQERPQRSNGYGMQSNSMMTNQDRPPRSNNNGSYNMSQTDRQPRDKTTYQPGTYQERATATQDKIPYQTYHKYGSNPERRNNKYNDMRDSDKPRPMPSADRNNTRPQNARK